MWCGCGADDGSDGSVCSTILLFLLAEYSISYDLAMYACTEFIAERNLNYSIYLLLPLPLLIFLFQQNFWKKTRRKGDEASISGDKGSLPSFSSSPLFWQTETKDWKGGRERLVKYFHGEGKGEVCREEGAALHTSASPSPHFAIPPISLLSSSPTGMCVR